MTKWDDDVAAFERDTLDVAGSSGRYRARRTTIDRVKTDIVTRLANGPATANELKYAIHGGGGYVLTARRELAAEGRVVVAFGSHGRKFYLLAEPPRDPA